MGMARIFSEHRYYFYSDIQIQDTVYLNKGQPGRSGGIAGKCTTPRDYKRFANRCSCRPIFFTRFLQKVSCSGVPPVAWPWICGQALYEHNFKTAVRSPMSRLC